VDDGDNQKAVENCTIDERMISGINVSLSSDKPSIALNDDELVAHIQMPYCYLCSDWKPYSNSRLKRHFLQLHLGHSVRFNGCVVALCKRDCKGVDYAHFHCPHSTCQTFVRSKQRLLLHYKNHFTFDMKENEMHIVDSKPITYTKSGKRKELDLPPPKKTFPFSGVQYFPHASIWPTAEDLFDYLCLPYCYLCDSDGPVYYDTIRKLERHFRMAHMNRGVDCGSCYLVLCGLNCIPGKSRKHYHCPFCAPDDPKKCISTSRYRFWVHLEAHRRDMFVPKNSVKADPNSRVATERAHSNLKRDFRHTAEMNNVITPQNWDVEYNGQPVIQHASINTNIENFLNVASLPTCYLCNDDKDHIYHKRLLSHITRVHLKPMFQVDNIMVLLCKRPCTPRTYNRGHYHCFLCDFFALHKGRLEIHLQKHLNHIKKKSVMAEYNVPPEIQDHSVPDEWISHENRLDVREWERLFNLFINDYAVSKTHNKVITERMKWLIYNHVNNGMDIEHRSLKYWVQFRRINVISCPALQLENVLVMPLTKYNGPHEHEHGRPEPLFEGNELVLKTDNPMDEFFENFRLIPTCEEMFKLLYHHHIMDDNHPTAKSMFGLIRRKYLYLPRTIVDKFVELCPSCCVNMPDTTSALPVVGVENGDVVNLAGIQVKALCAL